jgi:hypothetical protein
VKNRYANRGSARDYSNTYDIAEQLPTRSKGKPGNQFLSNEELTTLWLTQPGELRMSMTPISRMCLVQNVSVWENVNRTQGTPGADHAKGVEQ